MRVRPVLSILLFAFVALLAPACLAQLPQASDTTSPPTPGVGHDYLGGLAETVNPANGSVSIRLSAIMPPGRGITLPFSFAYDSAGAFYYGQSGNNVPHYTTITNAVLAQGGWSYALPLLTHSQQSWTVQGPSGIDLRTLTCTEAINYVFQDPTGNRHNMGLAVNTSIPAWLPYCGGTGPSILQGGEGPILATTSESTHPPVTITDGNGAVYSFPYPSSNPTIPTSISDRNGNTLSISSTISPVSASVTDTLGRTAVSVPTFGSSPDNISVAGLGSPYQVSWTTASASFTISAFNLPGNTAYPTPLSGSANVVSQIVLPNSQKYTFTYDSTYGMLKKMVYPSGGYVRYVWGLNLQAQFFSGATYDSNGVTSNSYACRYDSPAVTDRYVSLTARPKSFISTFPILHPGRAALISTPARPPQSRPMTSSATRTLPPPMRTLLLVSPASRT